MIRLERRPERDTAAFDVVFRELPARARAGLDNACVAPPETWQRFLDANVPFPTAFWIAASDGRPCGRIGASLSPTRPGVGTLGFFEVAPGSGADAVASALVEAARAWLRARGARQVYGPVNFSTWFAYRLRTDHEPRAFLWEPTNPPSYVGHLQAAGLAEVATYHTEAVRGTAGLAAASAPAHAAALATGFRFEALAGPALAESMGTLHALSLAGFADNFLFEPISLTMFEALYAPVLTAARVFAHMVRAPDGAPAGFFFGFAQGEALVCKTATVLPAYRGRGLSNALLHLTCRDGAAAGLSDCIMACVKAGNRSEAYGRRAPRLWRHTYALYGQAL
jgi:GNAT superfamily N-acetyltransferase